MGDYVPVTKEEQQEMLRRLMQIQEDIEKMKRERMRV